ncbi:flagellar basal body L-ring protein, partial [Rubrivivax gelatinosus]|nr:flagellar basal body L-ring protein [Rubrivivax gelatinosus]
MRAALAVAALAAVLGGCALAPPQAPVLPSADPLPAP